jgi:mannosylglycoprotein endo-beta-mannosidase
LKNTSSSIAFFNQLQLLDKNLSPVRPSFYTDNFFSLLPGESKSVTIETADKNVTASPLLVVKGWNITKKQYPLR